MGAAGSGSLAAAGTARHRFGDTTFLGDDIEALREVARQNLALYTTFPLFQHLFRVSGFAAEAEQMENGGGGAALSAELLDAICLIGPLEKCRARLGEWRAAGVDMPILMPPIGVAGARGVIAAFSPAARSQTTEGAASRVG